MANLHLTKVAVGCRDLGALRARIAGRTVDGEVPVVTRMRPRRADELIGGNLCWIVAHRMVACQRILRFADRPDGRIEIICSGELIEITPLPKRAHQGWRYLENSRLATRESDASGIAELPPHLFGKLTALALV